MRYILVLLIPFVFFSCNRVSRPPGEPIAAFFVLNDKNLCIEEYRNEHLSDQQLKARQGIQDFTFREQQKIDKCPETNLAFACTKHFLGFEEGYLKLLKDENYEVPRHEKFNQTIGDPDVVEFYYKPAYSKQHIEERCQEPPKQYYKRYKYTIQ